MMKRLALLLGVCCVGALGCASKTFDLRGLRCEAGACLDGFTCDPVTDTCVALGDACEAGRYLSCDPDAVACENGCRLCDGGVWSDCQQIELGDCTPNVNFCEGRFLTTCDFTGNRVGAPEDCGVSGCNDSAGRCNECPPDRTFCDGLNFVTCGSDGLEATREDCTTANQCSGAGTCNAMSGCQVALVAPDGTPCDEGAGADGDFCNSSCVSGVCAPGPANCDDGNRCTSDTCDSLSGCVVVNDTGTPCPGSDSDACTSTCDGFGACADGVPLDCDDTNPCTEDNCDAGVCDNPPGNPGTECRAADGLCDVAEVCDGASAACPADDVATVAVSCRGETGTGCDVEEFCDGTTKDCPVDAVRPDTFPCRSPGGGEPCDAEELCDGSTKDCPPDLVLSSGVCRAEVPGGCDVEDQCNGVDKACPTDVVVVAGTECRAGGDVCDPPEQCDGMNPSCPPDATVGDDTVCALSCNTTVLTTTVCSGGTCTGIGTVMDCDDGLACNGAEMCSETLGCVGGLAGLNMMGPGTAPRRRTTASVSLDIGCAGEAANISCTATSSSLCLLNEDFDGGIGIFDGGGINTVTCGSHPNIPTSTGDDACSNGTLSVGEDERAYFASGFDISGFSDLRVFAKAGLTTQTDLFDNFFLMACCGADETCLGNIMQIASSSDFPAGQDAWGDRPCPGAACAGAGWALDTPTGCAGSSNLFVGFDMFSDNANEEAEVDDFFLAGNGTTPLVVSEKGDGTYSVDVSACSAVNLTVDCTWDAGAAGMVNDSLVVSFGN